MTIPAGYSPTVYAGNDVTTAFSLPHKVEDADDVKVFITVDATGVITEQPSSAFTVSQVGDPDGALVTMDTAPATGETLTLTIDPVTEQQTNFLPLGIFPAEDTEAALDRITRVQQVHRQKIDRSLRAPDVDEDTEMELPEKSLRVAKYLAFDADGNPSMSNGTGTDTGLREDLADGVANLVTSTAIKYDITPAESAAGVTPVFYNYEPGDARRFAVLDGVTDDATALTNWAKVPGNHFCSGGAATALVNTPVVLVSNTTFYIPNLTLQLGAGINNQYMVTATGKSGILWIGGAITGNGLAGISNVLLTTCSKVVFENVYSTKAGSMGIQLEGCTDCRVNGGSLSNNYFYGVSDRDGLRNKYTFTSYLNNGSTGVATSSGGRGINLWRCIGCSVIGNSFIESTEYGFRIYSEAADSSGSYGNIIIGNYAEDNAAADFLAYDESSGAGTLVYKNLFADNIVVRSTNATLGTSFLCQGGDNDFINCHVTKTGSFGNFVGFNINDANKTRLRGCSATNTADALGIGDATDCEVSDFIGRTVATVAGVAGIVGSGCTIRDSHFIHGGGGGADVALPTYNATGKNYYKNLRLDGFHTGFYIGEEQLSIIGCKTLNSTSLGIRKDTGAVPWQEMSGNAFDSTNNNVLLDMECLGARPMRTSDSAAPTTGTWRRLSHVGNTGVAAAGSPGWICVSNGTFSAFSDTTGDTDGSTGVITGLTSTTGLLAGQYVTVSAGFASTGPFEVLSINSATSITVAASSNSAQSNVTIATPDPVFKTEAVVAA